MSGHSYGPTGPGTVMLDLGGDTGALVLYTTAEDLGREIEISPGDSAGARRTHAAVRERPLDGRCLYGAVYPSLPAGRYTIWRDEHTPLDVVEVRGAAVTQYTMVTPARPA